MRYHQSLNNCDAGLVTNDWQVQHCKSRSRTSRSANQIGIKWVQLIVYQLIADYVIGVLKCVEERKRVNRRLTVTIKLIANYVIED